MASSNIKLFDENKANIMTDEEYLSHTQRINGVQTGIASSTLENKAQYQTSLVAYAIAQLMLANGLNAMDSDAVSTFVANLSGSLLQKIADKATEAEVNAGIIDTKWVTPKNIMSVVTTFFNNRQWTLLAILTSSGTFTVPAGYTKIGVYMIGGGGSGGAGGRDAVHSIGCASGGASGYAKNAIFNVTPGQVISYTIGAGGSPVHCVSNGNVGGTTTFNGVSAAGGQGGKQAVNSLPEGVNGGQGSDAVNPKAASFSRILYGGAPTNAGMLSSSFAVGGGSQSAVEIMNQFDPTMIYLSAGGFAGYYGNESLYGQTIIGPNASVYGGAGGKNVAGGDGVGYGSGGGALYYDSTTSTVTSGRGASGVIFVYGMKV